MLQTYGIHKHLIVIIFYKSCNRFCVVIVPVSAVRVVVDPVAVVVVVVTFPIAVRVVVVIVSAVPSSM